MSEGIVGSKPNVSPGASAPHAKSKVPFGYHLAGTYRFGELQPHFCAEVVNDDKFPLRSAHEVRSFNLKSPLLSDVQLKKAYFQVPNESILPLNWDKIYPIPTRGDDVVAENCNTVIEHFPGWLDSLITVLLRRTGLVNYDSSDSTTYLAALEDVLKNFVTLEYFFSNGSLFETLGVHIHKLFSSSSVYFKHFDELFDTIIDKFLSLSTLPTVNFGGMQDYYISKDRFLLEPSDNTISISYFLDKIRDDHNWHFITWSPSSTDVSVLTNSLVGYCSSSYLGVYKFPVSSAVPNFPLNYQRLVSYQLVCRHFFSNDKIDYIYSAELYRQLFYSALKDACNLASISDFPDTLFTYNGVDYRYDFLSGYNVSHLVYDFASNSVTDDNAIDRLCDCLRLLFGFNRSLRYLDYFTGSKTSPLAVGDINAPVVGGNVSAIDITRSISAQRLANFANRVGRKFEEYVSKLGGKYVAPDWHNPIFLGSTSDVIVGSETENTTVNPQSAGQPSQSTIANLRSNANKFAFEFESDRPSVIIGLTWFDIPRYYANVIERQNFHIDRYDMFNEFMQNIGDQEIYRAELTPRAVSLSAVFGYALRHIEYKTRVNQAFGGFTNGMLPSWEFIADESVDDSVIGTVSPDFIRSRSCELDPYYLSLTGWSRGTYFHFIIDNYNDCNPVRPMVYAPEIL